jgi:hypothetical protein
VGGLGGFFRTGSVKLSDDALNCLGIYIMFLFQHLYLNIFSGDYMGFLESIMVVQVQHQQILGVGRFRRVLSYPVDVSASEQR